ncbi:MAG: hypothetical protein HWQ58_15030 [Nostoc sp. LPT]|nr:hypothetical protein [Nostoc sp. LPT]
MIRVTFSVTRDLNAIFPDAIAKPRSDWDCSRDARYTP